MEREIIKFDFNYLKSIKKHLLLYNCNTEPDLSGGPIFNQENNKVIGLHIGSDENKIINIEIFIKFYYWWYRRKR